MSFWLGGWMYWSGFSAIEFQIRSLTDGALPLEW